MLDTYLQALPGARSYVQILFGPGVVAAARAVLELQAPALILIRVSGSLEDQAWGGALKEKIRAEVMDDMSFGKWELLCAIEPEANPLWSVAWTGFFPGTRQHCSSGRGRARSAGFAAAILLR